MKARIMISPIMILLVFVVSLFSDNLYAANPMTQPLALTDRVYEEVFTIPLRKEGCFYGNIEITVKAACSIRDKYGEITEVTYRDLTTDAYDIKFNHTSGRTYKLIEMKVGAVIWSGYIQLYEGNGNITITMRNEYGQEVIYN